MDTGAWLVWLASLWLYAGGAVAAVFLLVGIDRVEANARGAYLFRPLLVPGIILLWPIVLWRWLALESSGGEANWQLRYRPIRTSHARVWSLLALLIPVILVGALVLRQSPPAKDGAAIQISKPEQ